MNSAARRSSAAAPGQQQYGLLQHADRGRFAGGFTNVHNNRGNLAYSDGHAGSSTPQEFRETMRKVWKDDAKVIYYRDAADGFKVIN